MGKFIDITGQKFGNLTAIRRANSKRQNCGKLVTYWECICDCGNKKIVRRDQLMDGTIKSCGCLKRKYKYNCPRLYTIWRHMIERCTYAKNSNYKNYGGRGIKVCEEWSSKRNGFDCFYEWAIKNGYNPNANFQECTLDRINNNGNYEPSNCRWVTNYIQSRNKNNNVYIKYNGENKIMADWAKQYNIKPNIFRYRYINGWSFEKIVNTPVKKRKKYERNNKK